MIIWLPRLFYDDRDDRGLPNGREIRRAGNRVLVELDQESYNDMVSDAEYYRNPAHFNGDYTSLCRSARSTLKALLNH